jgi:hypothetical protein
MKLSVYLKAINKTKTKMEDLDEDTELVKKKYSPFIVNRCLSFFPDVIIQVNNMNANAHLDKDMQFEYLRASTRPRSRFSTWQKKGGHANLDLIKEFYGYSNTKAYQILDILTEEDLNTMREQLNTGGC